MIRALAARLRAWQHRKMLRAAISEVSAAWVVWPEQAGAPLVERVGDFTAAAVGVLSNRYPVIAQRSSWLEFVLVAGILAGGNLAPARRAEVQLGVLSSL